MEDCKYGRIPPCYGSLEFAIYEEAKKVNDEWKKSRARHGKMIDKLRDKLMEGGFLDDTHWKVYGLNKQMCDIGRLISVEEMAERYNKQISQSRLDGLSAWLKLQDMEEKKTIKEWKEAFADLYKAMRKELGAIDLDVNIFQNEGKPIVNFDIRF